MRTVAIFVFAIALSVSVAKSQPVIVDGQWTLLKTIDFQKPGSPRFHPLDGSIYVVRRYATTDGVFRLDPYGGAGQVATADRPASIAIDPTTGDIFFDEDYGGSIFHVAYGTAGRTTWSGSYHSGDCDPMGMVFVPANYTGPVFSPGSIIFPDRGYLGPDGVWAFDPQTPNSVVELLDDSSALIDGIDIGLSPSAAYIADTGDAGDGHIWRLDAGGALVEIVTSETLADPAAIRVDPVSGLLYVLDAASGRVVTIDPATGAVSTVLSGLVSDYNQNKAALDFNADGLKLVVSDNQADEIYLFGRCATSVGSNLDCNDNGACDFCDIALGTSEDCNLDGSPDECEIAAEGDCNADGLPDDCYACPPVEVVFIMDTSSSMDDEAAVLCQSIDAVSGTLANAGISVSSTILGISDQPGGGYSCLTGDVVSSFGTAVPGSPPDSLSTLGDCAGGNEVIQEDWALATAIVAADFPWAAPGASTRLIIPLSDEGPKCGDPVTAIDQAAVDYATGVAQSAGVLVSPITGSGSLQSVLDLADQFAAGTGGRHFLSSSASYDVAQGVVDLVRDACSSLFDCDDNGRPDTCDLAEHPGWDFNEDGVLDACQSGVTAADPPRAQDPALRIQAHPNPFNPATVLELNLDRAASVRLCIYDVSGRVVRTLVDGEELPAGLSSRTWHGRDDAGRVVSAGVYFYRAVAGEQVVTGSLTLIK